MAYKRLWIRDLFYILLKFDFCRNKVKIGNLYIIPDCYYLNTIPKKVFKHPNVIRFGDSFWLFGWVAK